MQDIRQIQASDNIQDSRVYLVNTMLSVLSQNSGATAPTTNLQVGMPFWNTSTNILYVLTSLNPVTWTNLISTDALSVQSLLDRLIIVEAELVPLTTISNYGLVITTTNGTVSIGMADTTKCQIVASVSGIKLNKPLDIVGATSTTKSLTTTGGLNQGATVLIGSDAKIDWNRVKNSSAVTGTSATRYENIGVGVIPYDRVYYIEKVLANGIRLVHSTLYTNCNCNCNCDCNCNGL